MEIIAPESNILHRFYTVIASYVVWLIIGVLAYSSGFLDASLPDILALLSVITFIQVCIFLSIKSQINNKFYDPSLTIIQVILALTVASLFVSTTQEIRGAVLFMYFNAILFGVFRLQFLGFMTVATIAIVGYGVVIMIDIQNNDSLFSAKASIVQWFIFMTSVFWLSLFCNDVQRLKTKLKEQANDLQEANDKLKRQRIYQEEKNKLQIQKIGEMAAKDALTGVFNRRRFLDKAYAHITSTDVKHRPYCICLADLDHFKSINDTYGHQAGDTVLQTFCQIAQNNIRSSDIVARYGGEEFVIFFPIANLENAQECAERIRRNFAAYAHNNIKPGVKFTASFGISIYVHPEDLYQTLSRADKALYESKHKGRNRITVA